MELSQVPVQRGVSPPGWEILVSFGTRDDNASYAEMQRAL